MSKLPSGMRKRGRSYVTRDRKGTRPDGRRVDRWVNLGKDRERAEQEFHRIRAGGHPVARVTVGQAAEKWLAGRVATARNEKGRQLAATRVHKYLVPHLGHRWLRHLSGEHLRGYVQWLGAPTQGLEPQTVAHVLSDARCFLLWGVEEGLLNRSPFPRRIMPRVQERPPDRLTEDVADKVAELPDPHGFAIRLSLGTGLRWGEMCRAQRSHLEGGELVVAGTKSGRVRRVPVFGDLLREIRGRVGRLVPFSENSAGTFNRTVRGLADLERFHVHQLRHTFACRFLERTGDLIALQEILGHASIETTQRYARLSADHVRRAAAKFAAEVGADG